MSIDVQFIDAKRKSTEPPNPKFPHGMMINLNAVPMSKSCSYKLPYPAPGVGQYIIICRECGFSAGLTVAGRVDDPRVITIPCKQKRAR